MTSTLEEKRRRAEEMTKDLPTLLTRKEVEDFFRVSRETINMWLKAQDKNYFPGAMKLGGQWRFPKADIIELAIRLYSEREEENDGTA